MKKVLGSIFLILSGALLSQNASAQWLDEVRFSSCFGFREIQCERFAPSEHLDFVDYLKANEDYPEDEYLGLALLLDFKGPWQTDLRLTLNSGWGLSGCNLKIKYFPWEFAGLTAGMVQYPHYMYYYEEYLNKRDPEFYTDVRNSSNHKYTVVADRGWMAGFVFPLDYKFLHLTLHLQGGRSSIVPFEEEFGQKRLRSNYKRDLVYASQHSYNWFFFPEASFSLDLIRVGRVRIGFQAQASWYLTQKFLDYTLTTFEWTYDSPMVQEVQLPRHRLEKLEFDGGLVIKILN